LVRAWCFALVAVAVFSLVGCESGSGTAWCDEAEKHQAAFKTEEAIDTEALAAYDRVAQDAPPELRRDLRYVRQLAVAFFTGDPEHQITKPRAEEFVNAIERVDEYLREECGANIATRREGS
jgi:hypothetical protein